MALAPVPALFDQMARGWRGYALIAVIALAAALPGVGRLPVMDRDEARFVQATRQMRETGDYVRIRVQDDDRNKKPIGIHWLQAGAATIATPLAPRQNAIWPYRLPSVLGAVLAALATFWAGNALMNRRAALIGSALFASTMLLGFEGMTAKTDAALAGFTTLAMAVLARLWAQRDAPQRPKAMALLFWAAFGAGVLIKGPVTPLVVVLTLAALGLWEKRWAWMKPLAWWPGPLLAAAMVAPWMIAIGAATNGAFFAEAIGEDLAPKVAGGQEGHFALPGYHLLLLAFLIFPAAFALPGAARLGWRAVKAPRTTHEPLRFLIAWAIPTFILFELTPTKLAHYPLVVYPAIALLCGAGVMAAAQERWRITSGIGIALFAIAGAGLAALLAYGVTFMPGDPAADLRRATQAGLMGGGLLVAAIAALIFAPRPWFRVGAAILTALVISYGLRERILPEARKLLVSTEAVAALVRARLTPSAARVLWVVGYRETSVVFQTRTDIRLATPGEVGAGAAAGDALMVEGRALRETEAELARRGLEFERSGVPVSGLNYGNGDNVDLYVGRVAAPIAAPDPAPTDQ